MKIPAQIRSISKVNKPIRIGCFFKYPNSPFLMIDPIILEYEPIIGNIMIGGFYLFIPLRHGIFIFHRTGDHSCGISGINTLYKVFKDKTILGPDAYKRCSLKVTLGIRFSSKKSPRHCFRSRLSDYS